MCGHTRLERETPLLNAIPPTKGQTGELQQADQLAIACNREAPRIVGNLNGRAHLAEETDERQLHTARQAAPGSPES